MSINSFSSSPGANFQLKFIVDGGTPAPLVNCIISIQGNNTQFSSDSNGLSPAFFLLPPPASQLIEWIVLESVAYESDSGSYTYLGGTLEQETFEVTGAITAVQANSNNFVLWRKIVPIADLVQLQKAGRINPLPDV